jgi:methylase of polypeptide subunit release factors
VKPRKRVQRPPMSDAEVEDMVASLDRATEAIAAVHGRERADRARRVTLLAMQTQLVMARREWREETERRVDRALAAYHAAAEAERDAEDAMMRLAALCTGKGVPCLASRRRRCEVAGLRWFMVGARCADRCEGSEVNADACMF